MRTVINTLILLIVTACTIGLISGKSTDVWHGRPDEDDNFKCAWLKDKE